nr:division/cell wall cluster transcriptional repressor MraZ [Saprospiraceae bacterium]
MPYFGEYDCKLDSKGRMRLPSQLIRQMDGKGSYDFVVHRGFEKCLMLYEKATWDKIVKEVENLNVYNKKERQFLRYFFRGATLVSLDSADRLLLSKRQLEFAGIENEVIISPLNDRIEIWSPENYNKLLAEEPTDLSDLAEEVLGGTSFEKEDNE